MRTREITILTTIALVLSAAVSHAAIVAGQSIGIDFANGPATPGAGVQPNWNLIIGNVGPVAALDVSDGNPIAGVQITVAGFHSANCQMGENNIGFATGGVGNYGAYPFSDLSFQDGIFSAPGPSTVTLSGLDDGLRYDVLVLPGGPSSADTVVDVTVGGTLISQGYNAYRAGNVLNPGTFSGTSTDGSGDLVIQFNSGGWHGVCAIYVTAVTPVAAPPAVVNNGASPVGVTTATLNGQVTAGTPTPSVKIHWWESGSATTTTVDKSSQAGAFTEDLSGLEVETQYSFYCVATNTSGTSTSTTNTFTTVRPLVGGDVIAVDFSAAGGSAPNFNIFNSAGTIAAGSVINYTNGLPVADVSITLSGNILGFNNDVTAADWPGTAADPYYVLAADDIVFSSNGGTITLKFDGLDDDPVYNVRIYSLINHTTDTQRHTVTDGASVRVVENTRGFRWGQSTIEGGGTVFAGVKTDGNGSIVIDALATSGNAFLNAIVLGAAAPGTPVLSASTVTNITTTNALGSVKLAGTNANVTLFWGTSDEGGAFTWDNTNALPAEQTVGTIDGVAISNLTADTQYYCIFYASNSISGLTGWSHGNQSFGSALTGKSVTNLAPTTVNATEINLTWTDNFNAETGYVIQRSPDGSSWTPVTTVGAGVSEYADMGLLGSSTYHYRIAATNRAGASDWSSAAQAVTPARTHRIKTDFTEATFGHIGLLRDIPNAGLASITLDAANDRLVFATTGNTDMWVVRNNAPIGYVLKPSGPQWFMQAEVELATTNIQQVVGFTVYEDTDGAHPDFTFGLDFWGGAPASMVKLQGLADNDPNMNVSAGGATRVILRLEVEDDGAAAGIARYTALYDLLGGNGIQILGTYDTDFSNVRVGIALKTSVSGRTSYIHNLEIDNVGSPGTVLIIR